MANNIEFIAANDLPVTEAEEVDVLCVENGEMKRKPAHSLGGGGNCDLIIIGTPEIQDWGSDGWGTGDIALTLEKGDFETLKEKIKNHEPISGLYIEEITEEAASITNGEITPYTRIHLSCGVGFEDGCIVVNCYDYWFILNPDNTIVMD